MTAGALTTVDEVEVDLDPPPGLGAATTAAAKMETMERTTVNIVTKVGVM